MSTGVFSHDFWCEHCLRGSQRLLVSFHHITDFTHVVPFWLSSLLHVVWDIAQLGCKATHSSAHNAPRFLIASGLLADTLLTPLLRGVGPRFTLWLTLSLLIAQSVH